jgi:hypothetical protein
MFVRHGEKPGEDGPPHGVNEHGAHDPESLSVRGWMRAGALGGLFAGAPMHSHPGLVRPQRVLATAASAGKKSHREVATARPIAARIGVTLEDSLAEGKEAHLAQDVLGQTEPALIVWHHGAMAKLVGEFPVVNKSDIPQEWPEDRFDLIWVLVREPGDAVNYRFTAIPQLLLADDQGNT